MTTNSPNPVDGDVQALIADCQAEIKHIEHLLSWKKPNEYSDKSLKSKLARQQIALAALTAEPDVLISEEGALAIKDIMNREISGAGRYVIFERPTFTGEEKMMPLYTTPPAQLLRPVELPGGFSPAIGDIFDRQAPVMRRDREDGCWIHKAVVAELLRSLGHEVKE